MIDLHIHTTASDGFYTTPEVINQAIEKKLQAICITDHDTTTGLENINNNDYPMIEIVNGAELSVFSKYTRKLEILAIDIPDSAFNDYRQHQDSTNKRRESLTMQRLENLQRAGYDISYEDIAFDDKGNKRCQIRKPHFTHVLLQKGYIKHPQEAYDTVFSLNGVAHVESPPVDAKIIIDFIKQTKAKAIIAHPILTRCNPDQLYNMLKEYQTYGLDGIEVFHSSQNVEARKIYLDMIKDLNMITAGGSDFHGGSAHPEIKLGTGVDNNVNIPYAVLEEIRNNNTTTQSYYSDLIKFL